MAMQPTQVPSFLTASTPLGLKRKMVRNNLKFGYFIQYLNIQFANKRWYAWFYIDLSNELEKSYIDINKESE